MQELAPHIYMETAYAGVTLGAIAWDHGLLMIDSPLKPEDARSWRASLLNTGNSTDRTLINLDAHVDRTLGARAMECSVIGHTEMANVFHTRPLTFKAQSNDTGTEWESCDGISNTRWAPPDITFSNNLIIHWDNNPIILEHWPGSAIGSICIRLPFEKIIFIGDIATPGQPPFLADAELPAWINNLGKLLSLEFSDYIIISGRSGIIRQNEIKIQLDLLKRIQQDLSELPDGAPPEITDHLVPPLLAQFSPSAERSQMYQNRFLTGLRLYYQRHQKSVAINGETVSL
ncbi:MAG: hypothetical protein LWX83_05075 [Anaerolineae bacterium]|nr:hypothetical protein [Anaerolineae bacterium]